MATESHRSHFEVPADRVERALLDKKPLLSYAEARAEADRCLYCSDAPCIKACPTSIDIPTFIKKIATGNVRGSARTILEANILGYSCGRVCPTEVLCEGACVFNGWQKAPIKIGRLQRYATEHALGLIPSTPALSRTPLLVPKPAPAGGAKRVACVGAGPASLAFAAYVALEGHKAVIFEKRPLPGGLNTTGIAPYKLQVEDSIHEIEWIAGLGVEIKTGVDIGKDVSGQALLDGYDAVFLGLGLGEDSRLRVLGEDGPGVYGAVDWIERLKTLKKSDFHLTLGRVLVVGGGNTAIDVARECAQLGTPSVTMVYRRSADEMSGYHHEMEAARKEGVMLVTHAQPIGFVRDAHGKLVALRVAKMQAGRAIAGSEEEIACDVVCVAIGQSKLREVARAFPGVELDGHGCVIADPVTGATGNPKVFSGGDCVNGGKEVVNAVADGRNAARFVVSKWGSR
jgi:glutamate synthase (NADPH/NADH) small chain